MSSQTDALVFLMHEDLNNGTFSQKKKIYENFINSHMSFFGRGTILHLVCSESDKNLDHIKTLVEAGANVNELTSNEDNVLTDIVRRPSYITKGKVADIDNVLLCIKYLIEKGINVNQRSKSKKTVLSRIFADDNVTGQHYLIDKRIIDLLVENGAIV